MHVKILKYAGLSAIKILAVFTLVACTGASSPPSTLTPTPTPPQPDIADVATGGKMYDDWMLTLSAATPAGNSPLWALQTTNTRTGKDTWRCKECHGWDYKGKDGDYSSGSHATGFPGVYEAAVSKTPEDLIAALNGSPNANHDFSKYLSANQISILASFLKEGATIDKSQYIDYSTMKPKTADAVKGKQLFDNLCANCHGNEGKMLNFGDAEKPEYVGTIAVENPLEFVHKVRFGQPGARMPSAIEKQWSIQDVLDVLANAQTLPTK